MWMCWRWSLSVSVEGVKKRVKRIYKFTSLQSASSFIRKTNPVLEVVVCCRTQTINCVSNSANADRRRRRAMRILQNCQQVRSGSLKLRRGGEWLLLFGWSTDGSACNITLLFFLLPLLPLPSILTSRQSAQAKGDAAISHRVKIHPNEQVSVVTGPVLSHPKLRMTCRWCNWP